MRPSYLDLSRENPVGDAAVPAGEAPSLQGYLEERNAAMTARVAAEAEAAAARHAAAEADARCQDALAALSAKDEHIKRLTADLEEATKPAPTTAVEEEGDAKPDEEDQSGA